MTILSTWKPPMAPNQKLYIESMPNTPCEKYTAGINESLHVFYRKWKAWIIVYKLDSKW